MVSSNDQKVARGIEALTIIECKITREQLLDELQELQSFFGTADVQLKQK